MAAKDQIDNDALAAEWGVALEAEQNADGAPSEGAAAEGQSPSEAMAAQWATMAADDGNFVQQTKGGAERVLTQDEIDSLLGFSLTDVSLNDNSGIRAIIDFGDGLLRALADAGDHLRPAGPVDDDLAAQFHLRQRRSLARPHHLGAFRRLPQFDSAAGDPRRLQSRGMGQFRPRHGQFQSDLFDHRCAARRPPRPDRDPHRRPALHHDRDQLWSSA